MRKKTVIIIVSVVGVALLAAGLSVLIWWLVTDSNDVTDDDYTTLAPDTETTTEQVIMEDDFTIIPLEGSMGDLPQTAAYTRIKNSGDMFWWFYPSTNMSRSGTTRPIVLWLDGVTGTPPSLLANFAMFGPHDFNLNRRDNSWIDEYNLLFVDSPLGTGFSTVVNEENIPKTLEENAVHLRFTLESFYTLHEEYVNTPLYIFGEGHGSQLAVALAIELNKPQNFTHNLQGVVIGNGIISPAVALTKLGFYLEELGYIDANGRSAIENLSNETNSLVSTEHLEVAFDKFITLGDFVNDYAGAIAVNLGHIVEKLTRDSTDYFGKKQHMRETHGFTDDQLFMYEVVAPALRIPANITYDRYRNAVTDAFRGTFMIPATDRVEYILQNTNLTVTIYNGNLDAVSNTPGQVEWVENLQWNGQMEFLSSPRLPLVVNSLMEGYYRETERLQFYWMNAAGLSVPLDSPVAMRRVIQRIMN
ncbi:hypothetical protein K1T71_008853 [Dendrolimus kikuchii]|uniref:Uncharacterized protein n=1 Tax=Dendrolimus kikuchii TaxID=765133 RepID=A0ACC1CVF2_9NEOP|nr:hypothetical protein K1T71_008853 [Dendrolimus kikuchii]